MAVSLLLGPGVKTKLAHSPAQPARGVSGRRFGRQTTRRGSSLETCITSVKRASFWPPPAHRKTMYPTINIRSLSLGRDFEGEGTLPPQSSQGQRPFSERPSPFIGQAAVAGTSQADESTLPRLRVKIADQFRVDPPVRRRPARWPPPVDAAADRGALGDPAGMLSARAPWPCRCGLPSRWIPPYPAPAPSCPPWAWSGEYWGAARRQPRRSPWCAAGPCSLCEQRCTWASTRTHVPPTAQARTSNTHHTRGQRPACPAGAGSNHRRPRRFATGPRGRPVRCQPGAVH